MTYRPKQQRMFTPELQMSFPKRSLMDKLEPPWICIHIRNLITINRPYNRVCRHNFLLNKYKSKIREKKFPDRIVQNRVTKWSRIARTISCRGIAHQVLDATNCGSDKVGYHNNNDHYIWVQRGYRYESGILMFESHPPKHSISSSGIHNQISMKVSIRCKSFQEERNNNIWQHG